VPGGYKVAGGSTVLGTQRPDGLRWYAKYHVEYPWTQEDRYE
jgi:hypothetical protein